MIVRARMQAGFRPAGARAGRRVGSLPVVVRAGGPIAGTPLPLGSLSGLEALLARTSGTPDLRYGSIGPAVRRLQQQLAARGFDPGPFDGEFGPLTQAAVRDFQQAARIAVDGVVGQETRAALDHVPSAPPSAMTRLAVTAPDRTAPEATPKRKAAGSDTSGVPELIGKIPVGKGTVMGFVTVTIQKVGQGLRINAGSFADMTIDKIGGQWVVEQPGKPTEVIERATTASDGNGGVDATIDLKGARSPITFGIGADGRSLVCDGYSVQIS